MIPGCEVRNVRPSPLGRNVATMIPQRFLFLFTNTAAKSLLSDWWVSCQPWFTALPVLDSVESSEMGESSFGAAEIIKRQQGNERHFWAFCPQESYGNFLFLKSCFWRLMPYWYIFFSMKAFFTVLRFMHEIIFIHLEKQFDQLQR